MILKNVVSICAALVIGVGIVSTSAQAQRHANAHRAGGVAHGTRIGGAHINGARVVHGRVGGRYYRRGGYYYGGGYYYDDGWDFGGLVAGMIFGGALAAQSSYADSVGYCVRRFKSYDPRSGTYLGYDGYRHPCP